MQIELSSEAKSHLQYWRKAGNKSVLNKISKLTNAILKDTYRRIGKPEPL